jgi:voltage-gated potassium channel
VLDAKPRGRKAVVGWLDRKPLSLFRTALIAATVTLTVVIASGVAMWLIDDSAFPTVWDGLWWAAQTVTTVGYGDVVPDHGAAKAIAVLVMIAGIGFITIVTASAASLFVYQLTRARSHGEHQTIVEALDDIRARLERLERRGE